jgi:hypothetical protein
MCMQYGVDTDSDLHLLSLLKGFIDGLKNESITATSILEKYGTSCIDMIYTICDHTNDSWKSGIVSQENYLLEEIHYLERIGKHFISREILDPQDSALWEKLRYIYFNSSKQHV